MLINVDSNTKTGYNGADYDSYVEAVAGNLSAFIGIFEGGFVGAVC